MAIQDIHLYTDALDFAIVEMHKQRMKEINMFVKKLWQDTYCGKGNKNNYDCVKSKPVGLNVSQNQTQQLQQYYNRV